MPSEPNRCKCGYFPAPYDGQCFDCMYRRERVATIVKFAVFVVFLIAIWWVVSHA